MYSPEEINEALDAAVPWVEVRKVEAEEAHRSEFVTQRVASSCEFATHW